MSASIPALLLADGRLPTGGHAYSAGLEPALADGMSPEQVPDYIRARLMSVGRVEAAATVLTHRRAEDVERGVSDPKDAYSTIQRELLARTPSAPLRAASGQLGRGLARLVARLWPQAPSQLALQAITGAPQRPVSLGVATMLSGVDELQAARTCLYDDAQTVASAALKLLPIDPVDTVAWLLSAAATIDQVAVEATAATTPAELPATTAPLVEQWSLAHNLSPRRIFRA